MSLARRPLALLSLLLAVCGVNSGPLFTPELDAEIMTLNRGVQELWNHIKAMLDELQAAGKLPGSPTPGKAGPLNPGRAGAINTVSVALLEELNARTSELKALQTLAFDIGKESADNVELSRHPSAGTYIQQLREFQPKLQASVSKLEKEAAKLLGKPAGKPRTKSKKAAAGIFCGSSEAQLRARVKEEAARDARPFRQKAVDVLSTMNERQLQMKDKQRDLQTRMEGPDWPKEDWPLSTDDAQRVGDAEKAIQASFEELNKRLKPIGGLQNVHTTGDEVTVEQIRLLCEMMWCYSKLIDRHVESVKRAHKGATKKRKKSAKKQEQAGSDQPFSWLRDAAGPDAAGSATSKSGVLGQTFGSLKGVDASAAQSGGSRAQDFGSGGLSGLAGLAQVGSSFGALGGSSATGSSSGMPLRHPGTGNLGQPKAVPAPRHREWTMAQPVYSNDGEL